MADLINASFELFASLFILNHCFVLYKDKLVRGISLVSTVFFTLWGFWNMFYYPHIGQTASFYAGIMVAFTNALWVCLIWHYRRKEKKEKSKCTHA